MSGRTLTSKNVKWIGVLACAPLVVPLASFAEDGVRATLSISSRLESVNESGFDNPQREGQRLVNDIDFGLTSENGNQSIGIFVDTGLAFNSNSNRNEQIIEDPFLRFTYSLESRQSALNFNATYRRTTVDFGNLVDTDNTGDFRTGEGDRTNVALRTGLVLWRESPVTLSFNHLYARNSFSGEVDDSTSDSTTNRLGADMSLQINPVASVDLFASWNKIDRDDPNASDQTSNSVGIRTNYDVSKILSVSTRISYTEATSTNVNRSDSRGLGYGLGLDLELPNGSLDFNLTRSETINGPRDQAIFGRAMTLKRGNLSYSVGVTRIDNGSLNPLADIAFSYDVNKTSQFNVSLSQASVVNGDDDETIVSRLNLGYTRDINEISSLTARANFASQNALEDTGIDRSSFAASLVYRRDVGLNWGIATGYTYSSSRRDNERNRSTSTLFVGLERTFNLRP